MCVATPLEIQLMAQPRGTNYVFDHMFHFKSAPDLPKPQSGRSSARQNQSQPTSPPSCPLPTLGKEMGRKLTSVLLNPLPTGPVRAFIVKTVTTPPGGIVTSLTVEQLGTELGHTKPGPGSTLIRVRPPALAPTPGIPAGSVMDRSAKQASQACLTSPCVPRRQVDSIN